MTNKQTKSVRLRLHKTRLYVLGHLIIAIRCILLLPPHYIFHLFVRFFGVSSTTETPNKLTKSCNMCSVLRARYIELRLSGVLKRTTHLNIKRPTEPNIQPTTQRRQTIQNNQNVMLVVERTRCNENKLY